MTYTIHTGTHERRAKNDEFAFKKWPSQPLMMTSPLPTCAGASPSPLQLGKAAEITSFTPFCRSGSTGLVGWLEADGSARKKNATN
jgi:hypothetical protein